ncbi:MAG: hypothetical protein LUG19_10440 [Desulfovibrio sp.]|uniref:hypothetical protein n=1 Tax=Desulfovibrio sp. TaxID=885 RepID=UPI0025858248|nr:hypothetical protein [Desulfovibrio sp.]MCD7984648.1 hypothetical protein [Desulfovibrio sp.]
MGFQQEAPHGRGHFRHAAPFWEGGTVYGRVTPYHRVHLSDPITSVNHTLSYAAYSLRFLAQIWPGGRGAGPASRAGG